MIDNARPAPSALESPSRVVVASYNIHGCVGSDGRLDSQRIAAVLRDLDADVIGLQEVGAHTTRGEVVEQLEYLAGCLGLTPLAGPTLVRGAGSYGNALLTRLPIRDCRRIDLSVGRREPRGAIDVDLDVKGRRLRVIATHLGLGWRERHKQRSLLAERLRDDEGPVVVLGDLNQWWPLGRRTGNPWPGFAAKRGLGTYPSRLPLLALDRILARPAEAIDEIAVVRTRLAARASDHLPIRAVLRVQGVSARCGARCPALPKRLNALALIAGPRDAGQSYSTSSIGFASRRRPSASKGLPSSRSALSIRAR